MRAVRARTIEVASVCAVAIGLSVVMTWPLAAGLGTLGRTNTGDGLFSIWCVAWVARAIATDPFNLFDANIFFPHKATLAYSEANFFPGLLAVPAWLATENPYFAHNVVVLIAFALSVAGGYVLARYLTGSRLAAFSAGIAFAFCPFVFARTAHMQLLMSAGLPWTMWAFHRFVDAPSVGRSLTLGLVLTLQALSCAYYGVFVAMLVGLGTFWFAITRGWWRAPRYWALVALAAVVSLALVFPFFKPFLDVQTELGFSRSLEDASMYSADWRAWVVSAAWAHRWLLPMLGTWNEVLFPGAIALVLGAYGLWRVTRRGDEGGGARDIAGYYLFVAIVAFWASFGPALGLYTVLFKTIPVFSFLRAPARFGILVLLALVVGMAFAIARLSRSTFGWRRTLLRATPVLLVAELATFPISLRTAAPVNPAYRMLANLPAGVVVEFPFFYRRTDFPRHAEYMVNSTYHWRPMVNGYSDHIPQDFRDMVIPLSSFPTRESFAILEQRRARYAVFTLNGYDRRSREKLLDRIEQYREYLHPLSRENDVWLFEIVAWPR
ncbi:MAG: hypothetical protein JNM38_13220 [Acidobacteria bacterium]|nr:hypothetical protein [Acidobacteriota bacterium]